MSDTVVYPEHAVIGDTTIDLITAQMTDEKPDLSKLAHVVNVNMNLKTVGTLIEKGWVVNGPADLVDGARHYKLAVQAICGYIWVPTERVTDHNVCDDCMDTAARWIGEDEG